MRLTRETALSDDTGSAIAPDRIVRIAALRARTDLDLIGILREFAQITHADLFAAFTVGARGPALLVAREALADGWGQPRSARLRTVRQLATQVLLAQPNDPLGQGSRFGALIALPVTTPAGDPLGALVLGAPIPPFNSTELTMLVDLIGTLAAKFPQPAFSAASSVVQAVFQATTEGAIHIDKQLRLRALNPAFRALTGWGVETLGMPCRTVIACHDEAGHSLCCTDRCPLVNALETSRGSPGMRVVLATRGGKRELNVTTVAVGKGHALLLRDTSANQEAIRQRDAFLADVSHSLRNRMNSIHGFVELVASGHVGKVSARQRQLLSYAHTSSMELMEYIENLIYLTRTDPASSVANVESTDPGFILEEVEQHLAMEADSADIVLVREVPADLPAIAGDRMRIRQMLMNLTMNAIKFTPPSGVVRLEARRDGDALLFLITDTGIGIAPIDQPHVFERDYQSERTVRSGKSGGGLGLATARAIVEQHGGRIWFETAENRGTQFFVRLPLA